MKESDVALVSPTNIGAQLSPRALPNQQQHDQTAPAILAETGYGEHWSAAWEPSTANAKALGARQSHLRCLLNRTLLFELVVDCVNCKVHHHSATQNSSRRHRIWYPLRYSTEGTPDPQRGGPNQTVALSRHHRAPWSPPVTMLKIGNE